MIYVNIKVKDGLSTLVMLSLIFFIVIMPAQAASSGIVTDAWGNSYDLYHINGHVGHYASNPQHVAQVQSILKKIGKMYNSQDITNYIKKVSPKSPITGEMIIQASNKYPAVSYEIMMAIMQEDSGFANPGINSQGKMSPIGPRQRAYRYHNPGNVGNTDSGANVDMKTWQNGVDAVAKNLNSRVVNPGKIFLV